MVKLVVNAFIQVHPGAEEIRMHSASLTHAPCIVGVEVRSVVPTPTRMIGIEHVADDRHRHRPPVASIAHLDMG